MDAKMLDIISGALYNKSVIIKERIGNFSYCQEKRMLKLFKKPTKPSVKIVKGKDGKEGLKINGKLVLPVTCEFIRISDGYVQYYKDGVLCYRMVEDFLNEPCPASVSGWK